MEALKLKWVKEPSVGERFQVLATAYNNSVEEDVKKSSFYMIQEFTSKL